MSVAKVVGAVGVLGTVGCGGGDEPVPETTGGQDTGAPAVQLVASARHLTQAGTVQLAASASDAVGVTRVVFFDGTTKVGEDAEAPYALELSFSHANNGAHAFTAHAFDAAGNESTSAAVTVQVEVPWTKQVGVAGDDYLAGVATDAAGNLYVVGNSYVPMTGSALGEQDGYLLKYAPDGSLLWARTVGTSEYDEVQGVAVSADGHVYVVGLTYGAFEGQTNQGGYDLFLAQYTQDGAAGWVREVGSSDWDYAAAVRVDAAGNAVVLGNSYGTLEGQTHLGEMDAFVVRYAVDGTVSWVRTVGSSAYEWARGLAVDAQGDVFVAGQTSGQVGETARVGGYDAFLVKLSGATGETQWARQTGSTADDYVSGLAVAADGSLYLSGTTYGALEGDSSAGDADLYLARYAANGTRTWTRQLGSTDYDEVSAVAVDAQGNAYLAGSTYGELLGAPKDANGNALVASYSPEGTRRWVQQVGSTGYQWAAGVAVHGNLVYVVGGTDGQVDGQPSSGGDDGFIARFDTNGAKP
ncbi:hypothetical protein FGE12_25345 [Aggregicoccus sp. 17bor-14]|uniref:SBBP repeat-containing protein n=1 Tax=Myxococcaceae TaxID=31 RepID=UPI00129CA7A0|nr:MULTISPECIES: SBBP repeat-containing protein [Myxococcaceae]MBF5045758.1 SBBP repeat-containing protein [Simulacricoccus sp. 17bor-14]MRI91493.1 hypothetical protein [Aggregicoccus sp. 17bor-14]